VAQELELQAMGTRHWRIVACSAVTGAGLLDGFDWVVNDIRSRIYMLD
jgi:ADP-ribosylation factor-like protein 2